MIVFLVFLGASSQACNQASTDEREPIRFEADACPLGWFSIKGDHAGCRCPDEQDKHLGGPFDMLATCHPRPRPTIEAPRVDIQCTDPPEDCVYEGRVLSGTVSEVSCGTLVCPEPTCSIRCAAPPANCRYVGQVAEGPCGQVDCGKLLCEEQPRCPEGERRMETCWFEGVRGQARYTCKDGRWQQGECELGDELVPVELQ